MPFTFHVLPPGTYNVDEQPNTAYLFYDGWDDWFEFETTFRLILVDANGHRIAAGAVKIGAFSMPPGQRRPDLPSQFEALPEQFFSLGQEEDYYRSISEITGGEGVFQALNDIAYNLDLFGLAIRERVTSRSLLRAIPSDRVRNRFHRLAHGNCEPSSYAFSYTIPTSGAQNPVLEFSVQPDSLPPSNIHVLIGRNAVGKTRCLQLMTRALTSTTEHEESGRFEVHSEQGSPSFANVVSVAFSAFDPFPPLKLSSAESKRIGYSYIGLKTVISDEERERDAQRTGNIGADGDWKIKNPEQLSREFVESATECNTRSKLIRWSKALQTLEADPLFEEAAISDLASGNFSPEWQEDARSKFSKCSSGHKIVLLTITRLVELVDEQSLVLLDEPEGHLHPPLLSAFVRALSDLLISRNGVAVVATHSPVVLQEVPSSCVWKLNRSGRSVSCERPRHETFGENVGTLTHEVFGLEVTQSGFHTLLSHQLQENGFDYDATIAAFDGHVGGEGKAIIRALSVARLRRA